MNPFKDQEDYLYYETYKLFTGKDVIVYVEREVDIPFWYGIFAKYATKIKIDVSSRVKENSKISKKSLMNKIDKTGPSFWICINSRYDYLISDDAEDLEKIFEENLPYTLQTYTYSTENYRCLADSLYNICVKASLNTDKVFDFETFLAEYSKTIHELFLYSVCFYKKYKTDDQNNPFKMEEFRTCISLEDDLYIDDGEGKVIIQQLADKVNEKIQILRNEPSIEVDKEDVAGKIKHAIEDLKFTKAPGKENEYTYLFIEGEHIFDFVLKILDKVVEKLKGNKKLKDVALIHNDEISNLRTLLLDNENYESFSLIEKIKLDVKRYMTKNIAENLWKKVCRAKTNDEKGKSLEIFIKYVIEKDSRILEFSEKNKRSYKGDSEKDIVFRCRSTDPLWKDSNGIVPVECKNRKDPTEEKEISLFKDRVKKTTSKIGFFVAHEFTRGASNEVKIERDVTIGLISENDIQDYLSGKRSIDEILEDSNEETRLG